MKTKKLIGFLFVVAVLIAAAFAAWNRFGKETGNVGGTGICGGEIVIVVVADIDILIHFRGGDDRIQFDGLMHPHVGHDEQIEVISGVHIHGEIALIVETALQLPALLRQQGGGDKDAAGILTVPVDVEIELGGLGGAAAFEGEGVKQQVGVAAGFGVAGID